MGSGLFDGRWFQQILDAMTEHIAVIDSEGRIVMVNQAWRRFACGNGSPDAQWEGANYLNVCRRSARDPGEGGRQARIVLGGLQAVLAGRLPHFQWEYPCHSAREQRWFVMNATPLTESPGGAVITHVNITDRKLREEEILRQAHQDPLTGLANRRLADKQALQLLSAARRTGSPVAVLALDLDEFKPVNDTYGHAAGDQILKEVAARLLSACRKDDLVARVGGDEFVILLPGTGLQEAKEVMERLESALRRPIPLAGREIRIGASLGAAVFPDQAWTFRGLLQAADAAMYSAKTSRKVLRFQANGRPGGEPGPAVLISNAGVATPADVA
ncbi:MAG TPA: diguanylate cyclase [Thermoanaerobaculia bacterium]|jgi:diguanylate cyclase (GGDEF)-like protein